jgi:hypothetical protein
MWTMVAMLAATPALAGIENGYTAFYCETVDYGPWQTTVWGQGDSCALFNRRDKAEDAAWDDVLADADDFCEEEYNSNPAFWDLYCEFVCDYHGHERAGGMEACDVQQVDVDIDRNAGFCLIGDKVEATIEADVNCGCSCSTFFP